MLDTLLRFRRIGLLLTEHTVKLPSWDAPSHIEYWFDRYTQMILGINYITLDYRQDWI